LPKKELEAQINPLKQQLVHEMATHEPRNWQMPSNTLNRQLRRIWADEILPIAREAHARLEFRTCKAVARWTAEWLQPARQSKKQRQINRYIAPGRAGVVRDELHKAGWRLCRFT
jgi:hypothetical protein